MIRIRRALIVSGLLCLCLLSLGGCAELAIPGFLSGSAEPPAVANSGPNATTAPAVTSNGLQPTATIPPRATAATEESAATLISRALLNQPREYSFESYSVTIEKGTDKRTDSQGRGFVKGDRYRLELLQGEQLTTVILDGQKDVVDLLMLVKGEKIAVHLTPDVLINNQRIGSQTPRELVESLVRVGWRSGTETVGGHPTTIFETRNSAGEILGRYWIWIDGGMLIRAERRQAERTTIVEYMNHVVGPLPDDLFTVPADYKVQDGTAIVQAQSTAKPAPTAKPTVTNPTPTTKPSTTSPTPTVKR